MYFNVFRRTKIKGLNNEIKKKILYCRHIQYIIIEKGQIDTSNTHTYMTVHLPGFVQALTKKSGGQLIWWAQTLALKELIRRCNTGHVRQKSMVYLTISSISFMSLRFSQFSGCWLILSVYILISFYFPFVRLFGVR